MDLSSASLDSSPSNSQFVLLHWLWPDTHCHLYYSLPHYESLYSVLIILIFCCSATFHLSLSCSLAPSHSSVPNYCCVDAFFIWWPSFGSFWLESFLHVFSWKVGKTAVKVGRKGKMEKMNRKYGACVTFKHNLFDVCTDDSQKDVSGLEGSKKKTGKIAHPPNGKYSVDESRLQSKLAAC